jgi:hypothetical protein
VPARSDADDLDDVIDKAHRALDAFFKAMPIP